MGSISRAFNSMFVIYLHSYTVFKPLIVMFFVRYVVSAQASASVLISYNFTILGFILFEKRLCFKPKYICFVYSYVVHAAFPSCLRRRISLLFSSSIFLITKSTTTCHCHDK